MAFLIRCDVIVYMPACAINGLVLQLCTLSRWRNCMALCWLWWLPQNLLLMLWSDSTVQMEQWKASSIQLRLSLIAKRGRRIGKPHALYEGPLRHIYPSHMPLQATVQFSLSWSNLDWLCTYNASQSTDLLKIRVVCHATSLCIEVDPKFDRAAIHLYQMEFWESQAGRQAQMIGCLHGQALDEDGAAAPEREGC